MKASLSKIIEAAVRELRQRMPKNLDGYDRGLSAATVAINSMVVKHSTQLEYEAAINALIEQEERLWTLRQEHVNAKREKERRSEKLALKGFVKDSRKWEDDIKRNHNGAIFNLSVKIQAVRNTIDHFLNIEEPLDSRLVNSPEIPGVYKDSTPVKCPDFNLAQPTYDSNTGFIAPLYATHNECLKAAMTDFIGYFTKKNTDRASLNDQLTSESINEFFTQFIKNKQMGLGRSMLEVLSEFQTALTDTINQMDTPIEGFLQWDVLNIIANSAIESQASINNGKLQVRFLKALFEVGYHKRNQMVPYDERIFKGVYYTGTWASTDFPTSREKFCEDLRSAISISKLLSEYSTHVAQLHGYSTMHEYLSNEQYGPKYVEWFDRITDYYTDFNYAKLNIEDQNIIEIEFLTMYALYHDQLDFMIEEQPNPAIIDLLGFHVKEIVKIKEGFAPILSFMPNKHVGLNAPVFQLPFTLTNGKTNGKDFVNVKVILDKNGLYLGGTSGYDLTYPQFTFKDDYFNQIESTPDSYIIRPFKEEYVFITVKMGDEGLIADLWETLEDKTEELIDSAAIEYSELMNFSDVFNSIENKNTDVDGISKQITEYIKDEEGSCITHLLTAYGADVSLRFTMLSETDWDLVLDVTEQDNPNNVIGSLNGLTDNLTNLADTVLNMVLEARFSVESQHHEFGVIL
ncbi:hypothetical protein A1QO_02625 [Vibrio genomosp. F10 str. ZF-129]|uniref:Uncharacterized protein n=1 Tax=Vibrio genomosp. F10 str. ZF-129 TaxID=1187848 RepID=A0A1E5BKB4_9VIBR|nr:hypothetical protein [Vibrio genomosp. F10]OEE38292.1 hypothetical protein A1QO_02625 [Vibrio genomosp. F10 str. ZF-129]